MERQLKAQNIALARNKAKPDVTRETYLEAMEIVADPKREGEKLHEEARDDAIAMQAAMPQQPPVGAAGVATPPEPNPEPSIGDLERAQREQLAQAQQT